MTREKEQRSKALWAFYAISVALHAALGIGAVVAPEKQKPSEAVAIALQEIQEAQKAEAPPPPPPPPKPPPPKPAEKPKEEPKPEPEAEPEPEADTGDSDPSQFQDLGLVGGTPGGPGVAVAMNRPHEKAEAKPEPVRKKVASLGPRPGDCSDPPVKPRFVNRVMPEYTETARQADVEGDVVLEVLIDENGKVISVRVIKGLGHGLDEKAIEAARASVFTPALQCGKPIKFPTPIKFRFELGS